MSCVSLNECVSQGLAISRQRADQPMEWWVPHGYQQQFARAATLEVCNRAADRKVAVWSFPCVRYHRFAPGKRAVAEIPGVFQRVSVGVVGHRPKGDRFADAWGSRAGN